MNGEGGGGPLGKGRAVPTVGQKTVEVPVGLGHWGFNRGRPGMAPGGGDCSVVVVTGQ